MYGTPLLNLTLPLPVKCAHAGLFVSSGRGRHPRRIIDSYELIFVHQGRLGMFEEEAKFDLGPGDTLLLVPGRRQGGTAPYPPDLAFFWLHFHLAGSAAEAPAPELQLPLPQVAHLSQPERLEDLFRRFLNDREAGTLSRIQADLLLLMMLDEVAEAQREAVKQKAEHQTGALLADRARQLIHSGFHRGITTSMLARQLHCNPDYLGRVFRNTYGITICEAIHRQQVSKAKELLKDSPLNGNEIAAACGFCDGIYFRRIFRRYTGMTPMALRRLYGRRFVDTECAVRS